MSNDKTLPATAMESLWPQAGHFEPVAREPKSAEPGLRQHKRFQTQIRALLYCRAQFQTTIIHDLSCGGAGLTGAVGIMPFDDVTLQLLNGREIHAKVRWWVSGRAGVVFATALEQDDPLLLKAAKTVRTNGAVQ